MDRATRAVALALLSLSAAGLLVDYGATAPGADSYPDPADVVADYPAHVGESIHVWGTVTEADAREATILVGPLSLSVETPTTLQPGDVVQAHGRLAPDHRLDARRVIVSRTDDRRYMYVVSALGGLLAAASFLWRWRIDLPALCFRRR